MTEMIEVMDLTLPASDAYSCSHCGLVFGTDDPVWVVHHAARLNGEWRRLVVGAYHERCTPHARRVASEPGADGAAGVEISDGEVGRVLRWAECRVEYEKASTSPSRDYPDADVADAAENRFRGAKMSLAEAMVPSITVAQVCLSLAAQARAAEARDERIGLAEKALRPFAGSEAALNRGLLPLVQAVVQEFTSLRARLAEAERRAAAAVTPRPESEWHEDVGPVLWWRFPVSEPPYAGTPLDSDWPGYHTHWTPITVPVLAAPTGGEGGDDGR